MQLFLREYRKLKHMQINSSEYGIFAKNLTCAVVIGVIRVMRCGSRRAASTWKAIVPLHLTGPVANAVPEASRLKL